MTKPAGKSKNGTIDINGIMALIPHRYPMLLIDRVVEDGGHRKLTGIKNVTANEPCFQGHFPNNPIMPVSSSSRLWRRPRRYWWSRRWKA